ncbi:MAG: glycosyltransferase family 1 protein [Flavihumibacter sp.]
MRIGIEAQRLFRSNKFGVEIVALELIRGLQKIDKENEYFIFVKKDSDRTGIVETGNFKIVSIPRSPYPYWEQFVLPRYVKKYKIDLLHCTANTAPVRVGGIPVVLTLHDIIFRESAILKGSAYQVFGNYYRRFLLPFIIGKNRTLITVSDYERNKILAALKIAPEKIHTIHNAVSSAFRLIDDQGIKEAIREKYRLPAEFILYFGNTAPKKNMKRMLEAFALYCNQLGEKALPMVMTDPSGGKYTEQLLHQIGRSDILPRLVLVQHVAYQDLPVVYNLSTTFVYPSLRESFGLPLLEAMACGTPVIASNTSSIPEIGGDAAWLVNPEQSDEIAGAMVALIHNAGKLAAYRAKGLERAAVFTWENTAGKVLSLYKEILRLKN